jgi:hypothetical protein
MTGDFGWFYGNLQCLKRMLHQFFRTATIRLKADWKLMEGRLKPA